MSFLRLFLIHFLVLLAAVSAAPSVEVEQSLDLPQDPLPFGRAAELVIKLSWPAESKFQPPEAKSLELPGATVIDQFSIDRGHDGLNRKLDYHIVFTRFEPGEFTVGPVVIKAEGFEVQSKALKLKFSGSTPKEGDTAGEIREAKPVVTLSTADFWRKLAAWILGLLSLLCLLAAVVNYFGLLDRFRSPKARALKQMKRMSKLDLEAEQKLLRCVEILRTYLHEAYGIKTREATSKEIFNQVILDNRCSTLKPVVEEILSAGDEVKFAAKSLSSPEASDHFQNLQTTLMQEKKVAK